ncbi:MAG: sigma 54-interacting transcriptional regulator [Myxococcota bacterium]
MPDSDKSKPGAPQVVGTEVSATLPVSRSASRQGRTLVVIAGDRASSHQLPDTGRCTVGRGDEVDVRIDHPSVSREHACLHLGRRKELHLSDTGSSNGTHVRGKRLGSGERVKLAAGETFEVGSVLLMVQEPFGPETALDPNPAVIDDRDIVVHDRAMTSLYQLAERVAKSTINVLLLGETGVGKDVMARKIHAMSPRADKPFLPLNCGALAEQLLESELFGHEKGAFTGAVEAKQGLLEAANHGTVFLDEVGELPMTVQVKLLRVLEERQVRRVGGLRAKAFDIRFIAATNRDLAQAIEEGGFRSDLFYRLNGISLVIPPLRQRVGEIEGLSRRFITEACERGGRDSVPTLSPEASAWLERNPWPGNIRELANCIERAVLLCSGDQITLEHLPATDGLVSVGAPGPTAAPASASKPEHPERRRILEALEECAGNQTRAAKLLGISRNTLLSRLDQYDIPRPRKR